jgi:hypothetical protein
MIHARNAAMIALSGVLLTTPMISGCRAMKKKKDAQSMVQRLQNAPPIRTETLGDHHMLIMQAPNPGWLYKLDRDDRDREGWIVWVTIRKPDPAYMYPQRIVDKRLLTQVESDQPIRVMARLLAHDERGNSDQYAPLALTNQDVP